MPLSDGVTITLWIIAAALLLPAAVFCGELLLSLLSREQDSSTQPSSTAARPRVAVLIPAHNEEGGIRATLEAIRPQLSAGDQVLVVADNCTDETAEAARQFGRESNGDGAAAEAPIMVVERQDSSRRGKGYALSAGLAALDENSYNVLIMIDADCHSEAGAIDALARQVMASGKPAQAVYLMDQCAQPRPRDSVSAWAFAVKNLVRPLGLAQLGLPTQLTGTGMAFPRSILARVSLASGNIVEDMQLGLDLALTRNAPHLCPAARVTGRLPAGGDAALKQRRRWEHGHLKTLLVQSPRMAMLGLLRGNFSAVAMALDLMVPPLSLLIVLMLLASVAMSIVAATTGRAWHPAIAVAIGTVAIILSVLAAWVKFGRSILPARSLVGAVGYIAWKIPMYAMFVIKPERKWERTARDSGGSSSSDGGGGGDSNSPPMTPVDSAKSAA